MGFGAFGFVTNLIAPAQCRPRWPPAAVWSTTPAAGSLPLHRTPPLAPGATALCLTPPTILALMTTPGSAPPGAPSSAGLRCQVRKGGCCAAACRGCTTVLHQGEVPASLPTPTDHAQASMLQRHCARRPRWRQTCKAGCMGARQRRAGGAFRRQRGRRPTAPPRRQLPPRYCAHCAPSGGSPTLCVASGSPCRVTLQAGRGRCSLGMRAGALGPAAAPLLALPSLHCCCRCRARRCASAKNWRPWAALWGAASALSLLAASRSPLEPAAC